VFYHPITFKEAAESLGKRKQTPTLLKAKELAQMWSDDARAKAFFSARVASATILSELHRRAMQVVDGEMTDAQARNLIRRYFVGPGAKPLQNLGFAPKEDATGVAQLASAARIELILETNVRMAQEVGHYQQWAEFRDTYKYGIWKCGYSKEHRVEHLARDGRAYAFDHPIWTQSPPGGEFNCHCYRVLATEEDLEEMGIKPEKTGSAFQRSSLGFDPSRGFREPPEFGKRVLKEYKDIAKRQIEQYEGKQQPAKAFPADLSALKEVKSLGGSTGARLMSDSKGNRFVMKKGGSAGGEAAEHLKNEARADAFYQAAGVKVPEFKIYETANGPVKLSRFVENGQSLGEWWNSHEDSKERKAMLQELEKGFNVDVLIGNWDIIGMGADNILIDPDGIPWRIDNGGSFGFRAQGERKKAAEWLDGWPDDLWSMRESANNKRFFGHIKTVDLAKSIAEKDWNISALPPEDQKAVKKRLEEITQIARRGEDFQKGSFTDEFIERVLPHSYKLSKEGFREEVTKQVSNGNYGFFRSTTPKGAPANPEKAKEADIKNKILDAAKTVNHHNKAAGDKQPNMQTVGSALGIKPELEALANSGNTGAQYYLDRLNAIEQAAKTGGTVPQLSMKHEIFTAPPLASPASSRHTSLTDHIHDYMRRNGGDASFITNWQFSQANNSYDSVACEFKWMHLRAMGISDVKQAKKAGYYMGESLSKQKTSIKKAFDYLKKNPSSFDKNYESYIQYKSAIQLILENTTFEGRDEASRSVILGRTEEVGKVVTVAVGELSPHARGAAESHFVWRTVSVKGDGLTAVRVPYSRINGMFFLERHPGGDDGCFLGDGENEFNADTRGLPALYLGKVRSGLSFSQFRDDFLKFEKKGIH
jgi:hypothetical protein